jgi:hypothetical protein
MATTDDYAGKVNAYVATLRIVLGLEAWTIAVRTGRNEDIGINDGLASSDAKYKSAYIDIAGDLDPDRLRHVVMHEMLHVALQDLTAPLKLFGETLKGRQREYLDSLIDYHEERLIERMAQSLGDSLLTRDDGTESIATSKKL